MLQTLIGRAALALSFLALASAASAADSRSRAGESEFRELYKELVETNTTLSSGSCTLAAERMAARLKAAGARAGAALHRARPSEGRRAGRGLSRAAIRRPKAMLLLAHIDVVEAKREDWTRDPFMLVEENGYFYGRGAMDDKAEAAIWVDTLIRYSREKFKPRRTIKLALTCGEETSGRVQRRRVAGEESPRLIDAEFALNEGAWGELDRQGKRVAMNVQAGEKAAQNYRLEVTNPGGHSSRPVQDNAIYHGWRRRCRASRPTISRPSSTTRAAPTSPAWRRSRPGRAMPKSPRRWRPGQGSGRCRRRSRWSRRKT